MLLDIHSQPLQSLVQFYLLIRCQIVLRVKDRRRYESLDALKRITLDVLGRKDSRNLIAEILVVYQGGVTGQRVVCLEARVLFRGERDLLTVKHAAELLVW